MHHPTTNLKEVPRATASPISGQFTYFANPATLWPDFLMGQTDRPLRILLVDEDARMRNVIGHELSLDTRTSLVSTASSLREGKHLIASVVFDVLLLDLNLCDGMGFELIKHMKMHRPSAEAIVISVNDDEEHAMTAFELGASGYIVKNSWFGNFAQAVLQVANGGAYISPNLARRLMKKITSNHTIDRQNGRDKVVSMHNHEILSLREKEILEMVATGETSASIAKRVSISSQTVTTHIKNIFQKLHVHTRAQAVMVAKSQGLLS